MLDLNSKVLQDLAFDLADISLNTSIVARLDDFRQISRFYSIRGIPVNNTALSKNTPLNVQHIF